jgi:cytochrome d ubiquinol oxidase subunit I
MVALCFLMVALGIWAAWARSRNTIYRSRPLLYFAVLMGPAGLVAILAGWLTTEIGRQPWVVYGVLRTNDAVSNHSALELSTMLIVFVVIYVIVFGTGVRYMLNLVMKGPGELRESPQGLRRVTGGRCVLYPRSQIGSN